MWEGNPLADFTPKDQFQQFVVDKLEYHTEKIDIIDTDLKDIQAQCPVWEIESRVIQLENDKKWYTKIIGVVGGFIGGIVMVIGQWFLQKHK